MMNGTQRKGSRIGINTLKPRQNGRHFADFYTHFLEWKVGISIEILLKVVPNGEINNIPALLQVIDWRRPGGQTIIWTKDG